MSNKKGKKADKNKIDKRDLTSIAYSIITIGDSAAGKTSLINRYLNDTFSELSLSTLGFERYIKYLKINDLDYKIEILDTTGQERYASLGTQYFRNCDGAILVYDVTDIESFKNIENWLEKLTENNGDSVPYVIFENKIDLPKEMWKVSREDVAKLGEKLQRSILSVSAKSGENVNDSFMNLIKIILEKNKAFEAKARIKLNEKLNKKSSGGFC